MNIAELEKIKIDVEIEIEKSYRKGFCHGVFAGRSNLDIGNEELNKWQYTDEDKVIGAPGTPFEGQLMIDLRSVRSQISDDGLEYLDYLKRKSEHERIMFEE